MNRYEFIEKRSIKTVWGWSVQFFECKPYYKSYWLITKDSKNIFTATLEKIWQVKFYNKESYQKHFDEANRGRGVPTCPFDGEEYKSKIILEIEEQGIDSVRFLLTGKMPR